MVAARCIKCGGENPKEALFCTACGHALHHAQNDPLVGQTIGDRYHVVERIGQGAAGTIYRAEHTTLRRRMAVKLLHQQLAQNEDAVERFRREAITVCEIDNDHIPQVFDFGRSEDGRLFFAMEFLDGVPLSMVLEREGKLTPDRVTDILTQIADGLMEAHTLGYIHRDLRPRSIFLTRRRGRADFVKILDFGLAKLVQPELTDAQRTAMGMTYGDPRYMAPEQARGEVVDRRADIYSLGVLGYEMLCGEPPFKGQGTFDVLSKLLEAPVPRLRDKRPDCPPWLESVIRTALAKKPAERFQTVAQFLDAMERKNVLANQPPLPMQVTPGAKAEAMKKLTPLSPQTDSATKGQEVRAFVSSPAMKAISVAVEEPPRPVAQATQVMPTVAPGTRAAALAAAVTPEAPPVHEQPQSIKKTLAYPAIKVGTRAEPPVSNAAPVAPAPAVSSRPAQTSAKERVEPVKVPASAGVKAPAQAKSTAPLKSGFVNIVATTIERGDPTPRTARAMVEQESLAWEEAALPALLTSEVDLTESATSRELTKMHPSADTPVEEMNFDAGRSASDEHADDTIVQRPSVPAPAAGASIPAAVAAPAAKQPSGPARVDSGKLAAPREPMAKEPSAPTAQRDSSRIAVMATPAPVAGREPSGPAAKRPEPQRTATAVVGPSPAIEIPRAKAGSVSSEVAPLSAPALGRQTQPGMGPGTANGQAALPILEVAPPASMFPPSDDGGSDEDATVPHIKNAETHRVEKTDGDSQDSETLKHPKLDPSSVHAETAKVVKVDPQTTKPQTESEKTPESPPPEMAHEGDAGWFAQSAPAALTDDDDAVSLKKPTPRWVIPAVVSAAALVGLVIWAQSGPSKTSTVPTPAPAEQPAAVVAPAENKPAVPATPDKPAEPKVEVAALPTATPLPTESKPTAAEVPAAKVDPKPAPPAEPATVAAAKTAEPAKATPKAEPLAVKAEPKAEPKPEPKPEPKAEAKPTVAKAEPKAESRPAPTKPEPKAEAKPAVAKAESKPAQAKPEPKTEDAPPAKSGGEAAQLVSLGKQKLDDGDVDAAVASFKRAVQLEPKNVDAVAGLGEASFEQGNFDVATKYLQQASKLSPRKASYLELLAQAQFKLGRYKEAADTCRKILKDHPGSSRAKQTLEQVEKKLDDM